MSFLQISNICPLSQDVCENDLKPLMEPEVSRRDKKALLQAWQQIYSSLFDFEGRTGLSAQSSESLYGTPSSLSAGQKQKSFISVSCGWVIMFNLVLYIYMLPYTHVHARTCTCSCTHIQACMLTDMSYLLLKCRHTVRRLRISLAKMDIS